MKRIVLLAALACSFASIPAQARTSADVTEMFGIEKISEYSPLDDPQAMNRARKFCSDMTRFVTDLTEKKPIYAACLRKELPANHYRIIDLTDPASLRRHFGMKAEATQPATGRNLRIEFPYEGQ